MEARRGKIALRDLTSSRSWTFAELFAAGDGHPVDSTPVVCPRGNSPEFIISLLAAWREEKVVCPLEEEQSRPAFPALPENCAHLKWTSGTTGVPQLISFTEDQLAADAGQIVPVMGLRPDWPNLGVISLAHSYGFSNLVVPLLLHGIPLILAPSPLPETIRRIAAEEPSLTLAAVPALWRIWHDAGGIPAQIRLAISAGAPLPLPLERAVFAASSLKIHNFYGASECGGIAYDTTSEPRTDASFVGKPMPATQVTINDDGCLKARGPTVGQTYLPTPSPALAAGEFQSSDLAELKDGGLYLRGRGSDLINVAGRKVSPETIERALLLHAQVRECLVFSTPCHDSGRTDLIVAMVAASADESELKNFLLDKLPSWQVPRRWRFVDALPTTSRGKISRAECRAKFGLD
jgi:acyl-coenzyme A synthetase/AMP-(fatty) acid ligase